MRSIQHNLDCARLMVNELETYLLSEELFWYLPEGSAKRPPCPALTLGGLWLIMDELKAQEAKMTRGDLSSYNGVKTTMDRYHSQWLVAWEKKAVKELSSRLHLWGAFLIDVEQDKTGRSRYASEIKNRVIASYAARDSGNQSGSKPLIEKLRALDSKLRGMFEGGPFIWDDALQPIYPKDGFWFLYGAFKDRPAGD
jgi:hypothetical protein